MDVKLGMGPYVKNVLLRRIFGPQREDFTGQWPHLCGEELGNL
jgi:hypothetical protein